MLLLHVRQLLCSVHTMSPCAGPWYSIRTPQANGRLTTLIRVEGDKSTEQQDQEEWAKRLYSLDSTA